MMRWISGFFSSTPSRNNLTSFVNDLHLISTSEQPISLTSEATHLFSNEIITNLTIEVYNSKISIDSFSSFKLRSSISSNFLEEIALTENGCAVTVGESHLFSIIPLLYARGIRNIFQFDLDATVLSLSEIFQNHILNSRDVLECKSKLKDITSPISIDTQGNLLGELYYLHSEENFQNTKKALKECRIHRLNMDVLNDDFWSLAQRHNIQIDYLNISNLLDYWSGFLGIHASPTHAYIYYDEISLNKLKILLNNRHVIKDNTVIQYSFACLRELINKETNYSLGCMPIVRLKADKVCHLLEQKTKKTELYYGNLLFDYVFSLVTQEQKTPPNRSDYVMENLITALGRENFISNVRAGFSFALPKQTDVGKQIITPQFRT